MTITKLPNQSRREFLINSLLTLGFIYSPLTLSGNRLKVLLKLDDLVPKSKLGMSDNWKMVIEFLHKSNIAASFGVIGNNLDAINGEFSRQLSELSRQNIFEIWNHGYSKVTHGGKFYDSQDEQYNRLNNIQLILKEITGTAPQFYGPHAGNKNQETFFALSRIKEVKGIWFYKPPKELQDRFMVVPREVEAEKPIFYPNIDSVSKGVGIEKTNALQFHPDQWDKDRLDTFCNIVHMLSNEGASFILPSSLL